MKEKSMKTLLIIVLFLFVTSALLILNFNGNNSILASEEEENGDFKIEAPPKSLDKLYPPQAKDPILLIEMITLAKFFTSIGHDARQNDWPNAQLGFDNFKSQIIKLSGMIPEWKKHFNMDVVEELGHAVAQKNLDAVLKVRNEKVGGGMCGHCHEEHRIGVWYRYHWKDFGEIMVEDPMVKKKVPFQTFMFMVSESLEGIGIDLQQGQVANARNTFNAFNARAKALKKACENCHDPKKGERKYFVNAEVMGMIDGLGTELSKTTPAHEKVEHFFMEIGVEMCYECHQVHWPAGTVQRFWRAQTQKAGH
jgi:cytochrome c553